jgi:hypothetical protein
MMMMMMMKLSSFFVSYLALFASSGVEASPTGAAGCTSGQAAVVGGHTMANPTTGSLDMGSIQVDIDGVPLSPDVARELVIGEAYALTVSRDAGFKGVLARTEGITLIPNVNTQEASVCVSPAVGITHFDNEIKTSASGLIEGEAGDSALLEVTVVISNNADEGNEYYYSAFPVSFVASAGTDAPSSAATTLAPTADATADSTAGASNETATTDPSATDAPSNTTDVTVEPSATDFPTNETTIDPSATVDPVADNVTTAPPSMMETTLPPFSPIPLTSAPSMAPVVPVTDATSNLGSSAVSVGGQPFAVLLSLGALLLGMVVAV